MSGSVFSGRVAGLEIQERFDRRRAAAEKRGRESFNAALEWARTRFPEDQCLLAASAAKALKERGGDVTKERVLERCRVLYPDQFDLNENEQKEQR